MMEKKIWQWLTLVIIGILALSSVIVGHQALMWVHLIIAVLGIGALSAVLLAPDAMPQPVKAMLVYGLSLGIPFWFIQVVPPALRTLHGNGSGRALLTIIIMTLTAFAIWLLTVTLFAQVTANLGRIVIFSGLFFEIVLGSSYLLAPLIISKTAFLSILLKSNLFGALILLGMLMILFRQWQIRWNPWTFNRGMRWYIILVILIFSVMWISYNGSGQLFSPVVLFTTWAGLPNFSWLFVLTALEAGIAEEVTNRGMMLPLLARAKVRWLHNRYTVMFISGLIFGLFHGVNVFEQSLSATIFQIMFAMSFGWLLAAIALYSGSILYGMLFHFMTDAVSFFASGGTTTATPGLVQWIAMLVIVAIFTAVSVWLMRRQKGRLPEQTLRDMRA